MYSLKFLVWLSLAHCLTAQFLPLPEPEESSEETAGQTPGPKATSCRCGWTNKQDQGRIVGGKKVLPNEFPLMAGIKELRNRVFCGGSIITERHILTAAHCTDKRKNVTLYAIVGTHDIMKRTYAKSTQIIKIEYIIQHENYSVKGAFASDIAIAVLTKPIVFNQFVGPVCLPTEGIDLLDKYIKVLGWGLLNSTTETRTKHLMKVNLQVVEGSRCNIYLEEGYDMYVNNASQICTFRENKDSCSGDSGGPLLWIDPETNMLTQVALVSYGDWDCGYESPAVNTNVFYFLPWIKSTVAATNTGSSLCQKI